MPWSPDCCELLPKMLKDQLDGRILQSKNQDQKINLSELKLITLATLAAVAEQLGVAELGYVSGVISGQGDLKISENITKLAEWTEKLRVQYDFPIFGPPDIFTPELYKVLAEWSLEREERERAINDFWLSILSATISDIFMTPNWEFSNGAKMELAAAENIGAEIHHLK